MGSKGKGKCKSAQVPPVALQQRAMLAARRATELAAAGFPSFDQLKARTGKFFARVERKLADVPEDRLQPPPATIAAPAALQCGLLGDGDEVAELREMFENLLAASMDRRTASSAHPAFVSIISQLTPDEARILKSIDRDDYALVNVYQFRPDGDRQLIATRTRLGVGIGIDETRQQQYISNLDRLGILRISTRSSSDIEGHNALVTLAVELVNRGATSSNESIVVTPLGRQFLDTCVRARGR